MNAPTPATVTSPPVERMHCMEVWGGNREANKHLAMAGLETWIFSQPHGNSDGGGDVYYVSSCASGRITRMLLADVCGHGVEAATLAVGLRDLMRDNVNFIRQTRFVRAMNDQFAELSKRGRFATALVCSFFAPTRKLTLCNAGHPSPLLYRQTSRCWSPLESPSTGTQRTGAVDTPLGIVEQAAYSETETRMENGDMLLCFSDALPEALNAEGEQVGIQGMLRILESLDASEPEALIPKLCGTIAAADPYRLGNDDTTILLVRASTTKPSLKDFLLAPLRIFGPVRDHTSLY